jgi:hypothetical protein
MKTYVHVTIICRWILLRMGNVSDNTCRENQNTHLVFNNYFQKSCHLWDNVEKYGIARHATYDSIIRCMCLACWITKATNTHSEYVILTAFPRQQWLCEHASVLRYTYIGCLVSVCGKLRLKRRCKNLSEIINMFCNTGFDVGCAQRELFLVLKVVHSVSVITCRWFGNMESFIITVVNLKRRVQDW